MRTLILTLILAAAAAAQSKARLDQIRTPAVSEPRVVMVIPNLREPAVVFLDLSGFTLDTATNPPTLRAKAAAPREVWGETSTVTVAVTTLSLLNTPLPGTERIHRNGIRLARVVDYTISNNIITFVAEQAPQIGDVFTVDYRW